MPFQRYAAGNKVFKGGLNRATSGPVSKQGYRERDIRHRARRNALLRRMKAHQSKKYFSADWLKGR